ncbi:Transposase IS4 [Popillia japonica]|uniref:Transposase IS4 n=1 Tax=Popillia japonica TaxID=7064 RepID=A0AAW1L4K0_POPJA
MKCFIAILILTGYNVLPYREYYWDLRTDTKNTMVSDAMRRDRFRQILKYIHCADNAQPDNTVKVWKIRPFMDELKIKFINNWIPEENLDFDESMIKYYGRHSSKQFTRDKPIRFGYKMWCLNSPSGYLINLDMYQGKNPRGNENYEKQFGKCIAPLVSMTDEFPEPIKLLLFKFYFDNLFSGFDVLYYLKQKGYQGTGTIRENRIPKSCPLSDKRTFSKNNRRGTFESSIG